MEKYLDKLIDGLTEVDYAMIAIVILKIIAVIIVAQIVKKIGEIVISQIFKERLYVNDHFKVEKRRLETLSRLLKSVLSYVLYFIAGITILDIFDIKIAPILAAAGVLGVAVGFGAQNLVRDVISGFFIIFEDQYGVGEYVTINNKFGVVEEIGLRMTKIRDWTGELYSFPNGTVELVTNYNRGDMRAVVDLGIAYEEDIEASIKVIEKACDKVYEEMKDVIVEKPNVLGVIDLADSSVNIRVTGTARNLAHWSLERTLRQRIKEEFDSKGVEIPYPRCVYINGGIHDKVKENMNIPFDNGGV